MEGISPFLAMYFVGVLGGIMGQGRNAQGTNVWFGRILYGNRVVLSATGVARIEFEIALYDCIWFRSVFCRLLLRMGLHTRLREDSSVISRFGQ